MIEPWGKDSLRVRSTLAPVFIDRDWALTEKINHGTAKKTFDGNGASIINGMIEAKVIRHDKFLSICFPAKG